MSSQILISRGYDMEVRPFNACLSPAPRSSEVVFFFIIKRAYKNDEKRDYEKN